MQKQLWRPQGSGRKDAPEGWAMAGLDSGGAPRGHKWEKADILLFQNKVGFHKNRRAFIITGCITVMS